MMPITLMSKTIKRAAAALCVLCAFWALQGCAGAKTPGQTPGLPQEQTRPPARPETAMVRLAPADYPVFTDTGGADSLKKAAQSSLAYLGRVGDLKTFTFGPDTYTAAELKSSILEFLKLIDTAAGDTEVLNARIRRDYAVYSAVGSGAREDVLFTGYYVPLLKGSRAPSQRYRYPVYGLPEDRLVIDLGLFKDKYKGELIVGRVEKNAVVPYYDRQAIDAGVLEGKAPKTLWVDDRLDLFFLQIQGSGVVELQDGGRVGVGYAGNNGRAYRSIGRLLIEESALSAPETSMQSIKEYLRAHPEDIDRVLWYNESYVFFRPTDGTTVGSIGVPLTAARSIAADKSLFPKGALAYAEAARPEAVGAKGTVEKWTAHTAFVFVQDTGGAIIGPGRIDMFWGEGALAEAAAGGMKHHGRLFFLVKHP
jgi:membrane-bound lytic murein transglycosylase A